MAKRKKRRFNRAKYAGYADSPDAVWNAVDEDGWSNVELGRWLEQTARRKGMPHVYENWGDPDVAERLGRHRLLESVVTEIVDPL